MMKAPLSLRRSESVSPVKSRLPAIAVLGLGNWGTSLVAGLLSAGFPLREVVVRRLPVRPSRSLCLTTLDQAALDAAILWICVPDGAIAEVCALLVARRRASGHSLAGQVVLHSSGVLTVEALAAAAQAGARVACVHPLMTFPTRKAVRFTGACFAVESADIAMRRKLFAWVRRLGGEPFRIDSSNKVLYHAAATMASPLLLSGLVSAQQTAMLAGLSAREAARILAPLAASTVHNFAARGAAKSFSGPIARGDVATVQLHLQALAGHPKLGTIYRSLAINALEHLPARNKKEMYRVLAPAEFRRKH